MRTKIVATSIAVAFGLVLGSAWHARATDLRIKKTALVQSVMVGDTVRFEIIVDNMSGTGGGPFDSPNTGFTDKLPPELMYVSGEGDGASCSLGEQNTVTCTVGEVKKGTTKTIIITTIAMAPGVVKNDAQVKGDLFDPAPGNNNDSATITIEEFAGSPDIEVKKTASASAAIVGDNVTYRITVTNLALVDPAGNVVLEDILGPDVTFVSATSPCTHSSGTVTCNLGTLNGGLKVEIDLVVTVTKEGKVGNVARASTSGNDISIGNNSSEIVFVTVVPYLLLITELTVKDDCFEEVNPETDGTTDGNRNTFTVTVTNYTPDDKQVEVRFVDAETDRVLPAGTGVISFLVPAGASQSGAYTWNTTGFAWKDDESQHPDPRMIRVELKVDGAGSGEKEMNILVRPKPIILVHGLWSNAGSWDSYPGIAVKQHARWDKRVIAVGGINTGLIPTAALLEPTATHQMFTTTTIQDNANAVKGTIDAVKLATKSCHVDIVAHSMGGLMSRDFIHRTMAPTEKDGERLVRHLVQLGTPNEGSPCADDILAAYPTIYEEAFNLGFDVHTTRPPNNIIELTTTSVQTDFNRIITNQKGVPFHIWAGALLPLTCRKIEDGDGVVTLSSAYGSTGGVPTFTSTGVSRILHTALTADASVFDNFVKPILAEPPGNTTGKEGEIGQQDAVESALADQETFTSHPQYLLTEKIDILKDEALVVPIEVPQASEFGVTYLAPLEVTSTLTDPAGNPVDTVDAGSDEAGLMLRAHRVESPTAGTWKLTFDQSTVDTVAAVISVWATDTDLSLDIEVGQPNADDQIKVTATLADGAGPGTQATVKAFVAGEKRAQSFILFDDGVHGDGAEDDGVYAAWFRPRVNGRYLVSVTANMGGEERIAVSMTDVENVTEVSIEQEGTETPSAYRLHQNYPNPFNPVTQIRFAVLEREWVTLEVFDFLGKRVANLVDQWVDPGEFTVTFDGTGLPSGTYLYRMRAGTFHAVEQLTLLK